MESKIRLQIVGEKDQKNFIRLYGSILRLRNILTTFDDFADNEILTERDVQDYHSMYIDLYSEFRVPGQGDKENINDDIVFEMELVKQIEINIDYILELIRQYQKNNRKDKEILVDINKAIGSSIELRNKKELIEQFIQSLDANSAVDKDWREFVDKKRIEQLEKIIADERLKKDETYNFINNAFRSGFVQTSGTAIARILPHVSRFDANARRTQIRETVLEKLIAFFNTFFDISGERF